MRAQDHSPPSSKIPQQQQQDVSTQAVDSAVTIVTAQIEGSPTSKAPATSSDEAPAAQDQHEPALKRHKAGEISPPDQPVSDLMPTDPLSAAAITPPGLGITPEDQATDITPVSQPAQMLNPAPPVQRNLLAELGLAEGEVQLLGAWQLPAEPQAVDPPPELAEATAAAPKPVEGPQKGRAPARKQALTEEERNARVVQHQIYELISAGTGLKREWAGPTPVEYLQAWCEQKQVRAEHIWCWVLLLSPCSKVLG